MTSQETQATASA